MKHWMSETPGLLYTQCAKCLCFYTGTGNKSPEMLCLYKNVTLVLGGLYVILLSKCSCRLVLDLGLCPTRVLKRFLVPCLLYVCFLLLHMWTMCLLFHVVCLYCAGPLSCLHGGDELRSYLLVAPGFIMLSPWWSTLCLPCYSIQWTTYQLHIWLSWGFPPSFLRFFYPF